MALNFSTYPWVSPVIRAAWSSVKRPAWAASSTVSLAAPKHRGGKATHHQFCPAPSPMTTRRAVYSPAGRAKSSYSLVGNQVSVSSARTA